MHSYREIASGTLPARERWSSIRRSDSIATLGSTTPTRDLALANWATIQRTTFRLGPPFQGHSGSGGRSRVEKYIGAGSSLSKVVRSNVGHQFAGHPTLPATRVDESHVLSPPNNLAYF